MFGTRQPNALGAERPRHARVGLAFQPQSTTTLAVDADLTRTATEIGNVRRLAFGLEQSLAPRILVRGGLHVNTSDEARPAVAFGASVARQMSSGLAPAAGIPASPHSTSVGERMRLPAATSSRSRWGSMVAPAR